MACKETIRSPEAWDKLIKYDINNTTHYGATSITGMLKVCGKERTK